MMVRGNCNKINTDKCQCLKLKMMVKNNDTNLSLGFPRRQTLDHPQLQPVLLVHGSHETKRDVTLQ